jgi:hypothetical protein
VLNPRKKANPVSVAPTSEANDICDERFKLARPFFSNTSTQFLGFVYSAVDDFVDGKVLKA